MLDQMKRLMEMKKHADRIKRELDDAAIEVSEVRGIKVVVTGSQNFKSVEIDDSLFRSENKSRFEADLLRSLNAAINKSHHLAAQKMKSVLPGFPGI